MAGTGGAVLLGIALTVHSVVVTTAVVALYRRNRQLGERVALLESADEVEAKLATGRHAPEERRRRLRVVPVWLAGLAGAVLSKLRRRPKMTLPIVAAGTVLTVAASGAAIGSLSGPGGGGDWTVPGHRTEIESRDRQWADRSDPHTQWAPPAPKEPAGRDATTGSTSGSGDDADTGGRSEAGVDGAARVDPTVDGADGAAGPTSDSDGRPAEDGDDAGPAPDGAVRPPDDEGTPQATGSEPGSTRGSTGGSSQGSTPEPTGGSTPEPTPRPAPDPAPDPGPAPAPNPVGEEPGTGPDDREPEDDPLLGIDIAIDRLLDIGVAVG